MKTILNAVLVVVTLLLLAHDESVNAFASFNFAASFSHYCHHPLSHFATNAAKSTTQVVLKMARPGQSEAQARQERENEIRSKMAKLKSAGRMDKGGDGSESMMKEAEAFFNKESPVRKFERATKARKEKEAAAAAEALLKEQQEGEDSDEGVVNDNIVS